MSEWRAGHPHARRHRRDHDGRTSRRSPASSTTSASRSATTSTRTSAASRARSRSRSTATTSTTLRELAEQAENVIAKVPGVADPGDRQGDRGAGDRGRRRTARRSRAGTWTSAACRDYIETALSGHAASELWDGEKKFDVTVRFPRAAREDLRSIRELRVPLKDGVADPGVGARDRRRWRKGPAAITRENGKRYIGIRTNVRNRDLGSFDRRRAAARRRRR